MQSKYCGKGLKGEGYRGANSIRTCCLQQVKQHQSSISLMPSRGRGKKAYHQALRKAEAEGTVKYRGQILTAAAFGGALRESQDVANQKTQLRTSAPKSVKILSWNAGAVTTAIWEELLALFGVSFGALPDHFWNGFWRLFWGSLRPFLGLFWNCSGLSQAVFGCLGPVLPNHFGVVHFQAVWCLTAFGRAGIGKHHQVV